MDESGKRLPGLDRIHMSGSKRRGGAASAFLRAELLAVLVPLLVIGSVWLPELRHYYVPTTRVTPDIITASVSAPSDERFGELRRVSLHPPLWRSNSELLAMADLLLRTGEIELGGQRTRLHLPFRESDLEQGLPTPQLILAGLAIPEILLDAYRLSGRREFFDAARDVILAWARYERRAWLPRGFLWNDHAVAARAPVLAQFWAEYRRDPGFENDTARQVMEFVVRTGRMLAKNSQFTYATNHGVMQNIALLHLSAAFPNLPESANFRETAVRRLMPQMDFYINDEGVVLEHSAGYHQQGLELLGLVLWHFSLHDVAIPKSWLLKYERAKTFYAQLRRPDGSLPMFGNTRSEGDAVGPLVAEISSEGRAVSLERKGDWRPAPACGAYPVAGFAVWWRGLEHWPQPKGLSQTVVTWSNFPGHGHKLADDLSVLHWANGQTWWTNVGYWPYGVAGRDDAVSWVGSNAPHAAGEDHRSPHMARLHGAGCDDGMAAIDLERTTPDGYRVRRQVVDIRGRVLVVLDVAFDSKGRRTNSVWRSYPDVLVERGKDQNVFRLRAWDGRAGIAVAFVGPDLGLEAPMGKDEGVHRAIAFNGRPVPTPAFHMSYPSDGRWAAIVSSTDADGQPDDMTAAPRMVKWHDPSDWEMAIPTGNNTFLEVRRSPTRVVFKDDAGHEESLELVDAAGEFEEREAIRLALAGMQGEYEKHVDLSKYRARATHVLLLVLVAQEAALLFYRRVYGRHYRKLRVLGVVGWVALGLWMPVFYFRA